MSCRVTKRAALLAGVTALAFVTACGGAASRSSATPSATSRALELAQCMRQHGVANFPDPGPGNRISLAGIDERTSAFQAAEKICIPKLIAQDYGGKLPDAAQVDAFAQCVRRHGYPGFPDPKIGPFGLMELNWQAAGLTGGSPQAQKVSQECSQYLRQGGS
jgi:hypothetical protein